MAYSRRRASSGRVRAGASRTRRAPARRSRVGSSRRAAPRAAQTVKLVIQTAPYGGPDPFKVAAAAPRTAKH